MADHSKLSPSKAHRWRKCPGSVRECAKYPESPGGDAARDGTNTHTLLEVCLKPENSKLTADSFIGQTISTSYRGDTPVSFVVDAARAERVQFCLDYIDKQCDEDNTIQYLSECPVNPSDLLGRDDLGGTSDVLLIGRTSLEVIDLKDGWSEVDPDSPQLEQYAFGAVDLIRRAGKPLPQTVRLTILQPKRRGISGHTGVKSVTMTFDQLMERKSKLVRDALATDDPKAPLVPGEVQCKWCEHKPNCVAVGDMVTETLGLGLNDVTLLMDAANSTPGERSDDELVRICEAAPQIRQLLNAFEEEAHKRLTAGKVLPGFKLVNVIGNSTWWTDKVEDIEEVLIKMGIPKEVIYVRKIISPTTAKDLSWEKKKRGSAEVVKMSLSPSQKTRLVTEYVVRPLGKKPVMVPESDPRPAIVTDAGKLFASAIPVPVTPIPAPTGVGGLFASVPSVPAPSVFDLNTFLNGG